jgi:hypothetical protein
VVDSCDSNFIDLIVHQVTAYSCCILMISLNIHLVYVRHSSKFEYKPENEINAKKTGKNALSCTK